MRIILTILIATCVLTSQSQSHKFNIRAGANASLGGTLTTLYSSGSQVDQDTSAVLATMFPINFDYNLHKNLSLGVSIKTGTWLNEDPNDNNYVIKQKSIKNFAFGLKAFPVRKENFELYLGYDFAFSGFRSERESTGLILINEKQKWGGVSNNINLGTNFYFGGAFGMYFQLGYTGYNFNLKELSYNNEDQIAKYDISADMLVKGIQVELGFCYKLGTK